MIQIMKLKVFLLTLTLVMISATSAKAQVTIGMREEPSEGALLDLKEYPSNQSVTSTKGLGLPRVQLSDRNKLFPMFTGVYDNDENAKHVGLVVYNTAFFLEGPGLYAWNGSSWVSLKKPSPNSITDKRDDNWYTTGDFGTAGTWMTQSLRYKGAGGSYPGTGSQSVNQQVWEPVYGLLYTWEGVTGRSNISDDEGSIDHAAIQGICPDGWHVPSNYEWNELKTVISDDATGTYSTLMEAGSPGKKMKSTTLTGTQTVGGASKASNANGFDALLTGIRIGGGETTQYGETAFFWTSSSTNANSAYTRSMDSGDDLGNAILYKSYGRSVRCKKDEN
jgi:uncharacterized protein (TIGR02145 family)